MTDRHAALKAAMIPLRATQYDWDEAGLSRALADLMAPEACIHLCHPFGDLHGPEAFHAAALTPLKLAMPDLERRDWIVMSGTTEAGAEWVGCAGHFAGTFVAPFLGVPPTGHLALMRYHEFYRFDRDRVVEVQAIWDLPELMMQAGAWPMVPSLGREMQVPGPATCDGIVTGPRDAARSADSCALVLDMLAHMIRHPAQGGPEVMEMPRFWHPKMCWYGPAGIGTARGIEGFRQWHQIPFLNAMPDRGQYPEGIEAHFFGDNAYAAVTGWPDMRQSLTHDGWLGLAPSGQKVEMRSLDFWRIEKGLIRENWVLVDLLHVYDQLGVDVLSRMRAFNAARVPGSVPFSVVD